MPPTRNDILWLSSAAITGALHPQVLLFVLHFFGQNTNHSVIKVAKHTNEIGTAYINHDLSLTILSAQFTYSHAESDKLPGNSPSLQGLGKRRQPRSGFKCLGDIQKGGPCISIRNLVDCQILGLPPESHVAFAALLADQRVSVSLLPSAPGRPSAFMSVICTTLRNCFLVDRSANL